ncbi:uncharacterized protein LY89DRAFT_780523 [Mollisia scopiformis]|uniref:Uncharacterized protein n=1 Tax=Mollisia scopiformis TaxID=149040 RepID=A0A194XHK0_MOLSC|nr:uncharacterized protein LY89DRAFT_780523 [Mollisia scopiformis]KUJ19611.1 hypothetical protein LY89DRAFT_780523 [Mollisia scopiformis]
MWSHLLISVFLYTVHASSVDATTEPCAQVSAMVVPMRAADPGVTPIIPGELAFNCLQSVPLHSEEALAVSGALLPYVEFQSDLSFKKAPPSGFPYSAVDLVGSVTRIVNNLKNNSYPNEYAWQMDMFKTFMSAKDGHFRFAGDLISRPIRFTRNVSLVSVSMDGTSLPQIYVTDEILRMTANSSKPSAITTINGQDAVTFMQTEADKGFQQDPDAAFNTVMYNPALDFTPGLTVQGFFAGDGRYGFFYPGPNTTLNFSNGSTSVFQTMARVPGNFSGVTDGESAFQKFCTNPTAVQVAAPAPPPFEPGDPVNNTARLKGYPIAQVSSSDGQISGYYLTSAGHNDVGVISMNSFEPNTPAEFQAVIQTMLAEMKRDGKTKLVVDLKGNGGGIIINGYDAYRQLFPQTQDVLFARQRIGPVYSTLAQLTSNKFSNFSVATSPTPSIRRMCGVNPNLLGEMTLDQGGKHGPVHHKSCTINPQCPGPTSRNSTYYGELCGSRSEMTLDQGGMHGPVHHDKFTIICAAQRRSMTSVFGLVVFRDGLGVWLRHLRQKPHCLRGAPLKALVELFATYGLLVPEQQKPVLHQKSPLWRRCKLQTFFAEKQHIRYFVADDAKGAVDAGTKSLDLREADFFKQLSEDVAVVEEDAKAEANVVHGFGSHKSAVVPWLRRTGIEEHTRGLKKDEMHASFAVPKTAESEPELFLMLEIIDEIFIEAHSWCFDGPDCMLTWPQQLALSRFHTAAALGQKLRAFDPKKEPNTLKTNFGY